MGARALPCMPRSVIRSHMSMLITTPAIGALRVIQIIFLQVGWAFIITVCSSYGMTTTLADGEVCAAMTLPLHGQTKTVFHWGVSVFLASPCMNLAITFA